MTGGKVRVNNYVPDLFPAINYAFSKVGVKVIPKGNSVVASRGSLPLIDEASPISLKPQPWPGFPVDLLPLFIALSLSISRKALYLFHNWMYEGGLFWTAELQKFGANVTLCDPHRVLINTGNALFGATVSAPYIVRATVALVLVAMIAQGTSVILNADALKRGHPHFIENLRRLNADIEEI
jgi:UDP-N-acetylglucosamine 1-carboxyvinyltransferase